MDVKEILEEMKASPYKTVDICAPHTGVIEHAAKEGDRVHGPGGTWLEQPGSVLGYIEREHNRKPVRATLEGEVAAVCTEHAGRFVEAGTMLYTLRHYMTKEEVIAAILKKTLFLFCAPEQASYYFLPEVEKKRQAQGESSLQVHDGMDVFIVSRMKRETVLPYSGPAGLVYAVYFTPNESVPVGSPLIGVCQQDQLPDIQAVITQVKNQWQTPGS